MIAAILSRSGPPEPDLVRRMLAAAPHREGASGAVRVVGRCALTVSNGRGERGSGDGLAVALTGTLDNAAELAAAVARAGHPAVSAHPADVVAAAFRAFGAAAPDRMRGAFAGVVTDGERLWGFRDHIGFRPLFFRQDERALVVATEPKQVVVGAGLPREPDLAVLEQTFYGRMPADAGCALRGVSRLPQASTLLAEGRGPTRTARYWHPERLVDSLRLSDRDARQRLGELLDQAVRRSLAGNDVISLSGGVDSSAVAAYAGRRCAALSAVYPEYPAVDERAYIELTSRHFGLDLHTYVQRARVLDEADRWCADLDAPIPSVSIPELHENYALARRLGFRNVLTGELAEFVVGSPRHLAGYLLARFRWPALARIVGAERRRGRAWSTLARLLLSAVAPGLTAAWWRRAVPGNGATRIPDWIDAGYVSEVVDPAERRVPTRNRWAAEQLRPFGGATTALEADEACAARNGVTVRRPFADVDLCEFLLALAPESKFPDLGVKTLLKRSLRGQVPDAILDRTRNTVFDDHFMAQIDYPTLRRLLLHPAEHRMAGVDYDRLATRLEHADFSLFDWFWAKDLALAHAFLRQW